MGWDLTLTPYDAARLDALRAIAATPDAAATLRQQLDAAVPPARRDELAVERLNDASDLRDWTATAFAELAARGPGGFFGRTATIEDWAKGIGRRYPGAAAAFAALEKVDDGYDDLLSIEPGEVEGRIALMPPVLVRQLADAAAALQPPPPPRSPAEAQAEIQAGPKDGDISRQEAFFDHGAPPLLGLFRWAAERGLGLAVSYDDLPYLTVREADLAPDAVAPPDQALALSPPSDLRLSPRAPLAERPAPRGSALRWVLLAGAIALTAFLVWIGSQG